jgi:hypothetical protein
MSGTRIDILLAAYDRALQDEKALIPTYLHAAISMFRDGVNHAAEAGIREDQRKRLEGPDSDHGTVGDRAMECRKAGAL